MRYYRVGAVLLAALLFVTGCSSPAKIAMAPESDLPAFLAAADPRVREAYRFAAANHHALETVPCYCGCGGMGHANNLACFVQETASDGTVLAFDQHAAGCGICVDIAQDVMRMTAEGKSATAIRQYVDGTYAAFGPATDTPMP